MEMIWFNIILFILLCFLTVHRAILLDRTDSILKEAKKLLDNSLIHFRESEKFLKEIHTKRWTALTPLQLYAAQKDFYSSCIKWDEVCICTYFNRATMFYWAWNTAEEARKNSTFSPEIFWRRRLPFPFK